MDRRGFLKLLAAGAVGAAVDVDKLLWVPGAKTIFLPPVPTPPNGAVLDGFTMSASGLLMKGDVITIDGRYAVNPITRQPTKHLQQFVVMTDVTEGDYDVTISLHPSPSIDLTPADIHALKKMILHGKGKAPTHGMPFAPKSPRSGWVR